MSIDKEAAMAELASLGLHTINEILEFKALETITVNALKFIRSRISADIILLDAGLRGNAHTLVYPVLVKVYALIEERHFIH